MIYAGYIGVVQGYIGIMKPLNPKPLVYPSGALREIAATPALERDGLGGFLNSEPCYVEVHEWLYLSYSPNS